MLLLKRYEQVLLFALILMMNVILLLATIELGWILFQGIISPPIFILDITELQELFGFFLLVLIGIELVDSIKAYFEEHVVHAEVVVEVAVIAVARKVIILDIQDLSGMTLVGLAAIISSLALAYWLVKRGIRERKLANKEKSAEHPHQ